MATMPPDSNRSIVPIAVACSFFPSEYSQPT
jgi:hypothetical protein